MVLTTFIIMLFYNYAHEVLFLFLFFFCFLHENDILIHVIMCVILNVVL